MKAMNEYRFRAYFTYLIDLHNLDSIGQLSTSHPTGHGTKAAYENHKEEMSMELALEKNVNELLQCEFCGKKDFGTQSGLTRHVTSIHGAKIKKETAQAPTITDDCKKVAHQDNSNDDVVAKTGACDKVSAGTDEYNKQSSIGDSSSKCDPIVNLLESLDLGKDKPSDSNGKLPLICDMCGRKDFLSKGGLTQHQKTIHKISKLPENPVMCSLCDKVCLTQSGLTRHKNKVHQASFNLRTK